MIGRIISVLWRMVRALSSRGTFCAKKLQHRIAFCADGGSTLSRLTLTTHGDKGHSSRSLNNLISW